jgi:hypothetical protein
MVLCLKTRESRSPPGLPSTSNHIPSHSTLTTDNTPSGVHAFGAGWSSPVARQAHNLKVAGSNPAPATNARTYEDTHKPTDITQTTPSPLATMPAGFLSFTLHGRGRPGEETVRSVPSSPPDAVG